jgi:protein phosphatase
MQGVEGAKLVLSAFRPLLALDHTRCEDIGKRYPIPTFEESLITSVCQAAIPIFQRSEMVLNLTAPFYVIGDIHGNIFDVLRILIHTAQPPRSRLLFLGDYVDRGDFSVEVVTLLFSFLIVYPEYVFMLRGNHEFDNTNSTYGFAAEVRAQYSTTDLYEAINEVFRWMPLVAVVNEQIFCVHGGISPHVSSMTNIRKILRPLRSCDTEYVCDLMWSDPVTDTQTYDDSMRGLGVQFGLKALQDFLAVVKMRKMIRAHQCVQAGISKFGGDLLYTVFSCSCYEGQSNRCGLLFLDAELNVEFFSLPPIPQIPRAQCLLKLCTTAELKRELQADDSLALNVKLFDTRKSPMKSSAMKLSKMATSDQRLVPIGTLPLMRSLSAHSTHKVPIHRPHGPSMSLAQLPRPLV